LSALSYASAQETAILFADLIRHRFRFNAGSPTFMLDNIRADLRSYKGQWWEQGFWVMLVYRFGRWRYDVRPVVLRKMFSLLYKIAYKVVQVVTGIDLPCEAMVGRNFIIDHFGDIIVSGYAKFGDNCRIRNGVSVGLRRVEMPCAPTIGNNVDIGAGAKLLGAIAIGDNVLIGANAVVVTDVPSDSIAMGVPATIRPRRPNSREGGEGTGWSHPQDFKHMAIVRSPLPEQHAPQLPSAERPRRHGST
jgi:serine O-acetyltransferase